MHYCSNCKIIIEENNEHCPKCGTKLIIEKKGKYNKLLITSLVIIISTVLLILTFSLVFLFIVFSGVWPNILVLTLCGLIITSTTTAIIIEAIHLRKIKPVLYNKKGIRISIDISRIVITSLIILLFFIFLFLIVFYQIIGEPPF